VYIPITTPDQLSGFLHAVYGLVPSFRAAAWTILGCLGKRRTLSRKLSPMITRKGRWQPAMYLEIHQHLAFSPCNGCKGFFFRIIRPFFGLYFIFIKIQWVKLFSDTHPSPEGYSPQAIPGHKMDFIEHFTVVPFNFLILRSGWGGLCPPPAETKRHTYQHFFL